LQDSRNNSQETIPNINISEQQNQPNMYCFKTFEEENGAIHRHKGYMKSPHLKIPPKRIIKPDLELHGFVMIKRPKTATLYRNKLIKR
jgi:hypothetical protein